MMTRPSSLALAALATLALAAPATAADKVTSPRGTVYSGPASPDGSLRSLTGTVTPFGPTDGALRIQVAPDGTFSGGFILAARGGWIYGTLSGRFTSPTGATFRERLIFRGGTGKYARIAGYADVEGALDPADGTGVDTVLGGRILLR